MLKTVLSAVPVEGLLREVIDAGFIIPTVVALQLNFVRSHFSQRPLVVRCILLALLLLVAEMLSVAVTLLPS